LLVTVTFIGAGGVLATCGGVVAVMVVLLTTTTLGDVATSKVTVAPVRKLLPVMVTAVPPAVVPVLGLMALTVAPAPGGVGVAVVNDQIEPLAAIFAIVFPMIRQ
jgi:hypothetical protein